MAEESIHPDSGKRQIKIQPVGLPAIWVEAETGLCKRCQPYNECLNFNDISNKARDELNNLVSFNQILTVESS